MNDWNEEGDDYEDDCVDDGENPDCGMFPDDGVWTCVQIGSEPCEFCPNRELLGTNSEDDEDGLDSQNNPLIP